MIILYSVAMAGHMHFNAASHAWDMKQWSNIRFMELTLLTLLALFLFRLLFLFLWHGNSTGSELSY